MKPAAKFPRPSALCSLVLARAVVRARCARTLGFAAGIIFVFVRLLERTVQSARLAALTTAADLALDGPIQLIGVVGRRLLSLLRLWSSS